MLEEKKKKYCVLSSLLCVDNVIVVILILAGLVCFGGLVGMERSMLPLMASEYYHVEASAAGMSFIVTFGISKVYNSCSS